MPPAVLLSSPPSGSSAEIREVLTGAGFAVRGHTISATSGVELGTIVAAVIDVGEDAVAAATQTRRWRAELVDDPLPILWVLPTADSTLTILGLDSGADAVFVRPVDPGVFAAQMLAAARTHGATRRLAARARESALLGEQLTRLREQLEREHATARRLQIAFHQRPLPQLRNIRFHPCHRARGKTGGDFLAVQPIDANRVAFVVGDVTGSGSAASILASFLATSPTACELNSPGEFLGAINRVLLQLGLDEAPLVAMCAGIVNAPGGEVAIARAGLPAPVIVSLGGDVQAWAVPGPFLGIGESTYPTHRVQLHPGDRLLLATDGIRPHGTPGPGDDGPLLEAVGRHRTLAGQRFVEAVAVDLLAQVQHEDDVTLLAIEFENESPAGEL